MSDKDKDEKESVSAYGFMFLKEQVKALTVRVQELETRLGEVVNFLNSIQKVEEQPKPPDLVQAQPVEKKNFFGFSK